MTQRACFWSANRREPDRAGVVPLGGSTLIVTDLEGIVRGFRPTFDPARAAINLETIVYRWAAFWRRPNRFGGGAEDGATAKLVQALVDQLSWDGPVENGHESPRLLAHMGTGWRFNWSDETVTAILKGIGPGKRGVTPLQPLSPGGMVEGMEVGEQVLIDFGSKGVVELPMTTRLYPWVVEGAELEQGVPLGDYTPRQEYSADQFEGLPVETRDAILESFIWHSTEYLDDKVLTPVSMVAKQDRFGVLHGGRIKSLFIDLPARKPYLTPSEEVDFGEMGISKFPPMKVPQAQQ